MEGGGGNGGPKRGNEEWNQRFWLSFYKQTPANQICIESLTHVWVTRKNISLRLVKKKSRKITAQIFQLFQTSIDRKYFLEQFVAILNTIELIIASFQASLSLQTPEICHINKKYSKKNWIEWKLFSDGAKNGRNIGLLKSNKINHTSVTLRRI